MSSDLMYMDYDTGNLIRPMIFQQQALVVNNLIVLGNLMVEGNLMEEDNLF